jgi:hypothetical protein
MFDPRMILMLAAGTLLLLNGLMARGTGPSDEVVASAPTVDQPESPPANG